MVRIPGDGTRRRTQAFTHLQSHYLFRDRFGRPGNDKGKVEAPVRMGTPIWYSRQSRWTSPCKSDTIVELRVFAEVNDAV